MDLFQEMCTSLIPHWRTENQAVAPSIDMGWGRLFGGQLLGQATAVAQEHSATNGQLHSLHAHFIASGSVDQPVSYHLHPIRMGRSYSTVRVEAFQHDNIIFHAFLSFQIPESGLEHQESMPEVPPPEDLPSYQSTLRELIKAGPAEYNDQLSPVWLKRLQLDAPIDVRPVSPNNFLFPDDDSAERILWFRASQSLPEDPCIHQKILIWTSDFPMLGTALQPHQIPPVSRKVKMTSLDHSIWFYAPFRADEWLLCKVRSPRSGSGRGLTFASIFRRDGVLVASCAQEGMIRIRSSHKE